MIFNVFTSVLLSLLINTEASGKSRNFDNLTIDSSKIKIEINKTICHPGDSLYIVISNYSSDTIKGNLISIINTVKGSYIYLFDVKSQESYSKNFIATADIILPNGKLEMYVPTYYLIDKNYPGNTQVKTILSFRRFANTAFEYSASSEITINLNR